MDYIPAIALWGLAASTGLGVVLIEQSYRPLSLGISLEPHAQTNGEFLIPIPGRYALNLTFPRSNIPKPLLDSFATSQRPIHIACDMSVVVRYHSNTVLDTKVVLLSPSTLRAESMSFRLADLDAKNIGSFTWAVGVIRPLELLTNADPRLELQLSAPMREYRMIWSLILKLVAVVSGIGGLVLLLLKILLRRKSNVQEIISASE